MSHDMHVQYYCSFRQLGTIVPSYLKENGYLINGLDSAVPKTGS